MLNSARLAIFGFTKDEKDLPPPFKDLDPEEILQKLNKMSAENKKATITKLKDLADADSLEMVRDQIVMVDYPKPINRYQIVYESPHIAVEPVYYQCLNLLRDLGFPWLVKITDLYAASEHSTFWGAAAQKLGLQQDKVMQFMQLIGQFIKKDLFQLVRDIRWIDERINFHEDARKKITAAEITLKSLWTDLVDGVVQGQRVSANVFQMAQQLQFTTLPDWFFSVHPTSRDQIEKRVEALPIQTRTVKNVLKNKLEQYLIWREYNYKELKDRKQFELRYLKTHHNILRMYLSWLKPYMRHIERLQMDLSKLEGPELVSAFEGNMVEIETIAMRLPVKNESVYACILLTLEYRTKPQLSFMSEAGYHRGPIHVGEVRLFWRSYAWNKEQIEAFKKFKEHEDLDTISAIDSSIRSTLDAIGEDMHKYIREAEGLEKEKEEEKEKPSPPTLLDPFKDIFKGFKELGESFIPKRTEKPKTSKAAKKKEEEEYDAAESEAQKLCFKHYKLFKKSNSMVTW